MSFSLKMLVFVGVVTLLLLKAPGLYESSCTGTARAAVAAWHEADQAAQATQTRIVSSRARRSHGPLHANGREISWDEIRTTRQQILAVRHATADYDWDRVDVLLAQGPRVQLGEWDAAARRVDKAHDTCSGDGPPTVGLLLGVGIGHLWSSGQGLEIDIGPEVEIAGGTEPETDTDSGQSPGRVRRSLAFD